MVAQGLASRFDGVAFLGQLQRRGAGDGPPVVEDLRYVADRVRGDPLDGPQDQVPVLASLVALPEPADLADELRLVGGEVREVVLPVVQVGIPVRLEVGVETAVLHVDLVLVGVDQLRVGMGVDLRGDLIEGYGCQEVIVVKEGDEVARCHGERRVRGIADVAVLWPEGHLDPGIGGCKPLQDRPHRGIRRGVIRHAKLPVGVDLVDHRLDGLLKQSLGGIVHRHEDRDHGPHGEGLNVALDGLKVLIAHGLVLLAPFLVFAQFRRVPGLAHVHLLLEEGVPAVLVLDLHKEEVVAQVRVHIDLDAGILGLLHPG